MNTKLLGYFLFVALFCNCSGKQEDTEIRLVPQYTLTVSVIGQGSLSPDANGTYDAGTSITISAIPDVGHQFDRWEGTDNLNKTCANATAIHPTIAKCRAAITMNSNRNVQAYFSVRE